MTRLLLISGSTRSESTNSAFVRTAALCAPPGVEAVVYDGLDALPHFNPDLDVDPLPPAVGALRSAIDDADVVLFCTPEYAGTLPGSFKNLLDWTVGGTVMTDKPVAWVNVAADPRRGGGAAATLELVLGYVQARIVDEACISIPVDRTDVVDGLITRADARSAITALVADLVGILSF